MDFFDRQERARKKTGLLVVFFGLAVLGIIVVLDLVFSLILDIPWHDPELILWVAGGVMALVTGGSLVKMVELSQGGRVVATMLGGELVHQHSTDPAEQRLINVVEEMSIASGVPVPEIYLLPDPAINAFAAGHGPGDTAIGITRGAIERLNRDELQGVIAHEFSHILHGDMKLNIRLMGLLNGILCIAILGGILLRITFYMPSDGGGSRGDRKEGGGIVLALLGAGLALYLVGWIGVFFGNLIKSAVSRQREFLADAAAVQYTRNPQGIAGALWKIGKFSGRLTSPRAEEASHMYFGNGMGDSIFDLFATHPPIPERVKAIAPNFDPSSVDTTPPPRASPKPPPLPNRPLAAGVFARPEGPPMGFAAALLAGLPEFSRNATREMHSAMALVFSLVLDAKDEPRAKQLEGFMAEEAVRVEMLKFFEKRQEIEGAGRIALIDLAIPTLRYLSTGQYQTFRKNVRHLIESDEQIDLFEFVLQKVLLRHLDLYFSKSTGAKVKFRSIIPLLPDINTLLSALAIVGHPDQESREAAFAGGVRELLFKPSSHKMALDERSEIAAIDTALDRLAEAAPDVKRTVLKACAQAAASDGMIGPHEYEVLRAIADAMDCPLPPLPLPQDAPKS
ncbi:MAG: M48 family metallopeptidase [Terrimicrobiaceae bacterium]